MASANQEIQDYIEKLEETELPNIKQRIKLVDEKVRENIEHFEKIRAEIKSRGEKLKAEIDMITNEFINTCREIEQSNSDLLFRYKQELESVYSQRHQKLDKCKESIESGNNIAVTDFGEPRQSQVPTLQTVEFSNGQCPATQLQNRVGTLSIKKEQEICPSQELAQHITEGERKQYRSNDSTVISELKCPTAIVSMAKPTADTVWVSMGDKCISLVNFRVKTKEKVKFGSNVKCLSASPTTGNVWLCCNNFAVYEVIGKKSTKRFTTNYRPWSLCVTSDNSVAMVTEDHNVTVYSTTGKELHTTRDLEHAYTVILPRNITVCPTTGDIAVCDRDLSGLGGKDKPHVAVFDSKLVLKYRYYGLPKSEQLERKKASFHPVDVEYDLHGHLLIADCNNKCIQLVSQEGQFLAVVHTDELQPRVLTLIQDGQLCVSFGEKIKLIQYRV